MLNKYWLNGGEGGGKMNVDQNEGDNARPEQRNPGDPRLAGRDEVLMSSCTMAELRGCSGWSSVGITESPGRE